MFYSLFDQTIDCLVPCGNVTKTTPGWVSTTSPRLQRGVYWLRKRWRIHGLFSDQLQYLTLKRRLLENMFYPFEVLNFKKIKHIILLKFLKKKFYWPFIRIKNFLRVRIRSLPSSTKKRSFRLWPIFSVALLEQDFWQMEICKNYSYLKKTRNSLQPSSYRHSCISDCLLRIFEKIVLKYL